MAIIPLAHLRNLTLIFSIHFVYSSSLHSDCPKCFYLTFKISWFRCGQRLYINLVLCSWSVLIYSSVPILFVKLILLKNSGFSEGKFHNLDLSVVFSCLESGQTFLARKGIGDVFILDHVIFTYLFKVMSACLFIYQCLSLCDYWVICGIILEIMWTSCSPIVSHPVFFIPWSSPASVITLMIAKWWLKNFVILLHLLGGIPLYSLLPSPPFIISLWSLDSFLLVYYVIVNILFLCPNSPIFIEGEPPQTCFCVFLIRSLNALSACVLWHKCILTALGISHFSKELCCF